ncbi:MAG TPA: hypothetical protein PLP17_17135, partial [Oligoflexia bacterium]|nr:hypothetical protein [Oligoflexia bacterium]
MMRILSKRRAARNLHADQRGTAAVLTACLSAIFALTIIALIAHAHRFNRILALEHNIEKSSAQNASLLAQFLSARIHGNTAPLDVSTELLWSHTVPTLAAAAGSASEYPAQTRTLFLSMLSSPYSGAPRPDWGLLELRLAPSVTACIRWEDSSLPLQDEATASAATCTIISPLTGSVLVPGNLHPETELVIRNLQDQHVSLVVRGSAVISQGIALKNIRRSTIAIIASLSFWVVSVIN